MSEILPNKLYLGDYGEVKHETESLVEKLGINYFINVAEEVSYSDRVTQYFKDKGVYYYKFSLRDYDDTKFKLCSQPVIDLLHMLISNGCKVYIHCHLGVSRAPTIVVAYLIKYHGYSLIDAVEYVKKQRNMVQPMVNYFHRKTLFLKKCEQKPS